MEAGACAGSAAREGGTELSKQSAYFDVQGLSAHGEKEVKQALGRVPGVLSVAVSPNSGRVAVDYDSTGTDVGALRKRLEDAGFSPRFLENQDHIM